jgi:taurine transport system substrate-binding protein
MTETISHTSRRTLLRTAGLGAAALAMPSIVRAAPAPINAAFFVNTSPFMISKGEGWIDAVAGTKINWIEVGSGAEINTGIAAGSMDLGFSIGSTPTAAAISQGIPYEVVAIINNIGPAEEMTVRKAANIKTPADFKGKKVATPFGSTSHFRLLGFLQTNGLTQRDVTVLDMRGDAMLAAWTRGDIDAGYVWSPTKSKLLEAGGEVYRTYDKLEAAGYVIADCVVARSAFSQGNPEIMAGILKSYGRALDLYASKPDEAATLVGKYAGVSVAVAKADMAEYDFIGLKAQLTPAWLGAPGGTGKFATVLKSSADFLVAQKSIRSAPGIEAFNKAINTKYLAMAVA